MGIQTGARIRAEEAGRIGCCLRPEARFFARDAWIVYKRLEEVLT